MNSKMTEQSTMQPITSHYWKGVYGVFKFGVENKDYKILMQVIEEIFPYIDKMLENYSCFDPMDKIKISNEPNEIFEKFLLELSKFLDLKFSYTYENLANFLSNEFIESQGEFERIICNHELKKELMNRIFQFTMESRQFFLRLIKTVIEFAILDEKDINQKFFYDILTHKSINGTIENSIMKCIHYLVNVFINNKSQEYGQYIFIEIAELFHSLSIISFKKDFKLTPDNIKNVIFNYYNCIGRSICNDVSKNYLTNAFLPFIMLSMSKFNYNNCCLIMINDINEQSNNFKKEFMYFIIKASEDQDSIIEYYEDNNVELILALKDLLDLVNSYELEVSTIAQHIYSLSEELVNNLLTNMQIFKYVDVYGYCLKIMIEILNKSTQINYNSILSFWGQSLRWLCHGDDFLLDFIRFTKSFIEKCDPVDKIIQLINGIYIQNLRFWDFFSFTIVNIDNQKDNLLDVIVLQIELLNSILLKLSRNLNDDPIYLPINKIFKNVILKRFQIIKQSNREIVVAIIDLILSMAIHTDLFINIDKNYELFEDEYFINPLYSLIPMLSRFQYLDTDSPKLSLGTQIMLETRSKDGLKILNTYLNFFHNVIQKPKIDKYFEIIFHGIKFILMDIIPSISFIELISLEINFQIISRIIDICNLILRKDTSEDKNMMDFHLLLTKNLMKTEVLFGFMYAVFICKYQVKIIVDYNVNIIRCENKIVKIAEKICQFVLKILSMKDSITVSKLDEIEDLLCILSRTEILFDLFSLSWNHFSSKLRFLILEIFIRFNNISRNSVLPYFKNNISELRNKIFHFLMLHDDYFEIRNQIMTFLISSFDKNQYAFVNTFVLINIEDEDFVEINKCSLKCVPIQNVQNCLIVLLRFVFVTQVKQFPNFDEYFKTINSNESILYEKCVEFLYQFWKYKQSTFLNKLVTPEFWSCLVKLLLESKEICLKHIKKCIKIFQILLMEDEQCYLKIELKSNANSIFKLFLDNNKLHYWKWMNIFTNTDLEPYITDDFDEQMKKIDKIMSRLHLNLYYNYVEHYESNIFKLLLQYLTNSIVERFQHISYIERSNIIFNLLKYILFSEKKRNASVLFDSVDLIKLVENTRIYFADISTNFRRNVYNIILLCINLTISNEKITMKANHLLSFQKNFVELFQNEILIFKDVPKTPIIETSIYILLSMITAIFSQTDILIEYPIQNIYNELIESIWILIEKIYCNDYYFELNVLAFSTLLSLSSESITIVTSNNIEKLLKSCVLVTKCGTEFSLNTNFHLQNDMVYKFTLFFTYLNEIFINFILTSPGEFNAKKVIDFIERNIEIYEKFVCLYDVSLNSILIDVNLGVLKLLNAIANNLDPYNWLEVYKRFILPIMNIIDVYTDLLNEPKNLLRFTRTNDDNDDYMDKLVLLSNKMLNYICLSNSYFFMMFQSNIYVPLHCWDSFFDYLKDPQVIEGVMNLESMGILLLNKTISSMTKLIKICELVIYEFEVKMNGKNDVEFQKNLLKKNHEDYTVKDSSFKIDIVSLLKSQKQKEECTSDEKNLLKRLDLNLLMSTILKQIMIVCNNFLACVDTNNELRECILDKIKCFYFFVTNIQKKFNFFGNEVLEQSYTNDYIYAMFFIYMFLFNH